MDFKEQEEEKKITRYQPTEEEIKKPRGLKKLFKKVFGSNRLTKEEKRIAKKNMEI
jgi:hypothetical protein